MCSTTPTRADARRNRDRLLETAAAAFATAGGRHVPLTAIARAAGLGIGTIYRHFPRRENLIEAVYKTELAELAGSAGELLQQHAPAIALRSWMDNCVDVVAVKYAMSDVLRAMGDDEADEQLQARANVVDAVTAVLDAGTADGSFRPDVRADDVVAGVVGVLLACPSAEQRQRLLDLLVAGLTTAPTSPNGSQTSEFVRQCRSL